jgi:uncharacterized protein YigE (DUF2233 family)
MRCLWLCLLWFFAAPVWFGAPVWAVECQDLQFQGTGYSVCKIDMRRDDMRLFLRGADGLPYGDFATLNTALEAQGQTLGFAMNAGMYHPDRRPVGYYVEEGAEYMRLLSGASVGNFGLLPNGLLCLTDRSIEVVETLRFMARKQSCRFATQSGPMLVIDGALHPRFLKQSTSRYRRNGVGTRANGVEAIFVMSKGFVTFHQFASLFKDYLGVPQALYFDGNVSRLFAPKLNRNDPGRKMGPIIAAVRSKP